MSCDYGVWSPEPRLSSKEASAFYVGLCEGNVASPTASRAIAAFYSELTAKHPEIDDVSEEQTEDKDLCPWSCAFDRSDGHVIMSCIWPKAEYVGQLVETLAEKHGLAFYDPQSERIKYPGQAASKPWWKPW